VAAVAVWVRRMRDSLRPASAGHLHKKFIRAQVHGTLWWEYFNACAQALDLLDWINLHNKASSWDCAGQTYLMQFSRPRRQRQSIENFLTMRPRAVAGFVVFVCSFFTREWILCEFPEISQPASRSAARRQRRLDTQTQHSNCLMYLSIAHTSSVCPF